jgi:hypothetical protein
MFPSPGGAPPTRGLVSHLPFDGSGRDVQGRNPAVLDGATPTTDRFGRAAGALSFDGVNDRAVIQSPSGLDFDLRTESYTVALWVRSEGMDNSRLVSKWDEGNTPYAFSIQSGALGHHGAVYDRPTVSLVRVRDLWDGTWHHTAVTFDAATGALVAYRDGVETERVPVSVAASTRNGAPVWIGGAPPNAPARFFRGDIDDLLFYERALSAGEVQALARRTQGTPAESD